MRILGLFLFFVCFSASADDCLKYKITPEINLSKPDAKTNIIQTDEEMDLSLHGQVVANLTQETEIVAEAVFVKTGFCVSIKSINVKFGYSDFFVKIDKNYKKNTCPFNAVMKHEQKHIDTYLSVIDDFKQELKQTFFTAADSVMPVFIEKKSDFDAAVEMLNQELQNHPDLILVTQKIKAAEEIKNKKIDQVENGSELMKCFE